MEQNGTIIDYNYVSDNLLGYRLVRCYATDTRMLGVVALELTWINSADSSMYFKQAIHLDYSEYGVDRYAEISNDGDFLLAEIDGTDEWDDDWFRSIAITLGSEEHRIPPEVAIRLIEEALDKNDVSYYRHEDDIREFRSLMVPYMRSIIDYFRESGQDEEAFTEKQVMGFVVPWNSVRSRDGFEDASDEDIDYRYYGNLRSENSPFSVYETINYFVMRLFDKDYAALRYLSTIETARLERILGDSHDITTLRHNSIRPAGNYKHEAVRTYHNISIGEDDYSEAYKYITSTIEVTLAADKRDIKVTGFSVDYHEEISDFEAATILKRREFIAVYEIQVYWEEFVTEYMDFPYYGIYDNTPHGLRLVVYNDNNSHLDTDDYYLEGDVFGSCIITSEGELVIMSHSLEALNKMEEELVGEYMIPRKNYQFDYQVFKGFVDSEGMLFEEYINFYDL